MIIIIVYLYNPPCCVCPVYYTWRELALLYTQYTISYMVSVHTHTYIYTLQVSLQLVHSPIDPILRRGERTAHKTLADSCAESNSVFSDEKKKLYIVGLREGVEQRRTATRSQTLASHRLVKVRTRLLFFPPPITTARL